MNDFLNELYSFCMGKMDFPHTPQYHQEGEELERMRDQIEDTMGKEFLARYQELDVQHSHWETLVVFRAGIEFGLELFWSLYTH